MLFRQIADPGLAQYAYLVGCQRTGEALVVDPERDVDRYVAAAAAEGLTITHVAETHIHADFLSGAAALATQTGARLLLSAEGETAGWGSRWAQGRSDVTFLRDGDTFDVGRIRVRAVHAPGHTPEHLAYLVTDAGGGADEPMGLLSGDFVFVGDVGRPDLLESAAGQDGAQEPAARQLYASVLRFLALGDHVQVWPGHGAGSACGKALGAVPQTTVGYERRFNGAIGAARHGEAAFVAAILDGQPEPPLYFARMKRQNRDGVPPLDALPTPRALADLADLPAGAVVVDTRPDRAAFMAAHLPGALYAPFDASFATVVASYVGDTETPLVLVLPEAQVEEAVRRLVRIGLDRVVATVTAEALAAYVEAGGATASIPTVGFEAVRDRPAGAAVLDVRGAAEYRSGHVPGATNIAHTRLADRLAEVPPGRPLYVHCQSGVRAAVASAFLAARGVDVVYVRDPFPHDREVAGDVAADVPPDLAGPASMPDSDPMSFLSRLFGGSPQTTPAAAFVADRDPAAPVLDVRTPTEFADGHLAGAVNVDVNAPGFRDHVERLGLPADAPVYLYCRSGTRSGRATDVLHRMGHAGAVNVGGFSALRDAGAATA